MAGSDTTRETPAPRHAGRSAIRWGGRCVAGVSTCTLGLAVATMARAQNLFQQPEESRFKAAPKAPDAEVAGTAEAAAEGADLILGVPANTIFFVAAGVIAVYWFVFGGGRKAKVKGQH